MIADFHNDCLTKENAKELLEKYLQGKNAVVCAVFKGKRNFRSAFAACRLFEKYSGGRSGKDFVQDSGGKLVQKSGGMSGKDFEQNSGEGEIFLAFEDFSFEYERERERLLAFKPVCVSLTWNYDNFLAGGAKSQGGLKKDGRLLVKRLNELKIPVDCAHLNKKSFYEVIDCADGVVCTHTAFSGVREHCRNLDDDEIREIVLRGGMVGLTLYSEFLKEGGEATGDDVLRHIDYFVSKFGVDNLCLGTDFNGCEDFPKGYGDYGFEERLKNSLVLLGYGETDADKILYGNLLKYLGRLREV